MNKNIVRLLFYCAYSPESITTFQRRQIIGDLISYALIKVVAGKIAIATAAD